MLGRYWLPILAVVGLALGAQAYAQGTGNNPRDQSGTQESRPQPKVDAQPPLPVATQYDLHRLTRAMEALSQKEPSYTEESRAERNVKAQEDTATWALVMIFVGILEAAITGYGVYLVWQTLGASWAAAGHAQRAADAAEETLKETRVAAQAAREANAISKSAQRAWIAIESVELIAPTFIPNPEWPQTPDGIPSRWTRLVVEVVVKNIGHSPASHLNVSCILDPGREFWVHIPDELARAGVMRHQGGSVVLPGDSVTRKFELAGELPDRFRDTWMPHFILDLKVRATYRASTDTDTHTTQVGYGNVLPPGEHAGTALTRDGADEPAT